MYYAVLLLLILSFCLITSLVMSYIKLDFVYYEGCIHFMLMVLLLGIYKLLTGFNLMQLGPSHSRTAINPSW